MFSEDQYDKEATFVPKYITDDAHWAYESAAHTGWYMTVNKEGSLILEEGDLSDDDFLEKAESWKVDYSADRRRRKRATEDAGKMFILFSWFPSTRLQKALQIVRH